MSSSRFPARLRTLCGVVATLCVALPASAEHVLPIGPRTALRHAELEPVAYRLALKNPYQKTLDVEMTIRGYSDAPLDVAMPAWAPGAYRLLVPARNVLNLRASAGKDPLVVQQLDRSTWRITPPSDRGPVTVRYTVYHGRTSVVQSSIAIDYASISGFDTFLYVVGNIATACELEVTPWRSWEMSTSLAPRGPNQFAAPDYDLFIDRPILWGALRTRTFTVGGVPHHVVWSGDSDYDLDRLAADTKRLAEVIWPMFGGPLPFSSYHFLWRFEAGASGGLEHMDSTRINESPRGYHVPHRLERYWRVTAHEYVHTWNIKRIRPKGLGPFDYTREVYTPHLWFAEGVTSYLGDLALLRAGIWDQTRYLKSLSEALATYRQTGARTWMSAEQASLTTWHKAENGRDGRINYYNKGQLIGWLLDLELRRHGSSLEALMQAMYAEFRRTGQPFEDDAIQKTAEQLSGADFDAFFQAVVRGTEPLPVARALDVVGLRLASRTTRRVAWLGVETGERGDAVVKRVGVGSPASRAALRGGDIVAAVDNKRVNAITLTDTIAALSPGQKVVLTVYRGESVLRPTITLGSRDVLTRGSGVHPRIEAVPGASETQVQQREAWLMSDRTWPAHPQPR